MRGLRKEGAKEEGRKENKAREVVEICRIL